MFLEITLAIALAATLTWSILALRRQRRAMLEVVRDKVKVQTEERRVFDFLHGIGEALKDETHFSDLHGLLVEGALRILEGHGGADICETSLAGAAPFGCVRAVTCRPAPNTCKVSRTRFCNCS